jgi:hypothetical protein
MISPGGESKTPPVGGGMISPGGETGTPSGEWNVWMNDGLVDPLRGIKEIISVTRWEDFNEPLQGRALFSRVTW